jgi:hypothetical protein
MQNPMSRQDFIARTLQIARTQGYPVKRNRDGYMQIDFGHKKLHEGHLSRLYPDILATNANVATLIENMPRGDRARTGP